MVEPRFLRLLLGDNGITIRPCRWDVGMVQADACLLYTSDAADE